MRVKTGYRRAVLTVTAAGLLGGGLLTALPAHADVSVAAARTTLVQSLVPGSSVASTGKQALVTVDQTVTGAEYNKLAAAVRDYGSNARIQRASGTFRPLIAGGDAIYGSGYRCSLGFGVQDSSGAKYIVDAGHCGNDVPTWYSDSGESTEIGTTQDSQFPDNDYSLIKWTGSGQPDGSVNLQNGSSQDITSSGDPEVGENVQRSGSTSGLHDGTVQALDATVQYAEGTVNGLIQTDVCAEPGDSGGPLFDGSKALGLTSGGSGDCSAGGQTFFQPVQEALDNYGVEVY